MIRNLIEFYYSTMHSGGTSGHCSITICDIWLPFPDYNDLDNSTATSRSQSHLHYRHRSRHYFKLVQFIMLSH